MQGNTQRVNKMGWLSSREWTTHEGGKAEGMVSQYYPVTREGARDKNWNTESFSEH